MAGSALQESHGPAGAAADGPRGVAGGCGYSLSGEGGLGEVVRNVYIYIDIIIVIVVMNNNDNTVIIVITI